MPHVSNSSLHVLQNPDLSQFSSITPITQWIKPISSTNCKKKFLWSWLYSISRSPPKKASLLQCYSNIHNKLYTVYSFLHLYLFPLHFPHKMKIYSFDFAAVMYPQKHTTILTSSIHIFNQHTQDLSCCVDAVVELSLKLLYPSNQNLFVYCAIIQLTAVLHIVEQYALSTNAQPRSLISAKPHTWFMIFNYKVQKLGVFALQLEITANCW